MSSLLVPTDFSTCADNAVRVGIDLAKRLGMSIRFLHLFYSPVDWSRIPEERRHLYPELTEKQQEAQDALKALCEEAEAQGLQASSEMLFHRSSEEFSELMSKQQADLVVMGSHGATGLKEILLGSNAQRMLRQVPAPTLVVKHTQDTVLDLKHIAFASTFEKPNKEAFAKLIPLVKAFDARLHLVFINLPYSFEESRESLGRLHKFAADYAELQPFVHIYNAKDEQKGLLNFCEDFEIDLLALFTYGKSAFEQLFSPSLTEGIVNRSDFPVLALKED